MAVSRFSNSVVTEGISKVQNLGYTTDSKVVELSPTFWLDAAATSTLTFSGSNVSSWADKSGNSRNFTQGNASFYPAYNAVGLNNKPTIEFNASGGGTGGKWLDFGSSNFPLHATSSSPVTFFFVVKYSNPTWQQFYFTWNKATGGCTNFEAGIYDFGGNGGGQLGNGVHVGCSIGLRGHFPADEGIYIITIQIKSSGTSPNNTLYRVNKQTVTPANSPAGNYLSPGGYNTANGTCRIGARKDGDVSNNDSFFNGSVSEIILYKSELSIDNIQFIENYLSNKWGIAQ
jgi:hypothetical protein